MNKSGYDARLSSLEIQKKRAYLGILIMIGVIIMQSMGLVLMASKHERVVIVPSTFTEEFWLETNKVSSPYIRQMGDYFLKLAMTATPDTAESQYATILRNVYPPYYGSLKTEFIKKVELIKKRSVATVFNAREYAVDLKDLSVIITGDFELSSGKQRLDIEEKSYKVSFVYDNARLYVKEITEVEEEKS